ncbi:MAG: glycosyltransferase [Acidimicrobiales bacterium]
MGAEPVGRSIDAVAIVVPARDEADRIGACLRSVLDALDGAGGRRVEIIVVDDASEDETAAVAAATLAGTTTESVILRADARQAGAARIVGLGHVVRRTAHPSRTWILCTDADCVVPPSWIGRQLVHAEAGAPAVAGVVSLLDDADGRRIGSAWQRDYGPTIAPDGTHPHVHGANLGFRLDAYLAVGGFRRIDHAEDTELWRMLRAAGLAPVADAAITVATSARLVGRARHGFAHTLDRRYGTAEQRVAS